MSKVNKLKCLFGHHTWGQCNCCSPVCAINVCIYCGINEFGYYWIKDSKTGSYKTLWPGSDEK